MPLQLPSGEPGFAVGSPHALEGDGALALYTASGELVSFVEGTGGGGLGAAAAMTAHGLLLTAPGGADAAGFAATLDLASLEQTVVLQGRPGEGLGQSVFRADASHWWVGSSGGSAAGAWAVLEAPR